MSETLLAMVALTAGLVLGAGIALTILLAIRHRERAIQSATLHVPEGLVQALDALEDATALVDDSSTVRAVSVTGGWLGLTEGESIEQPGLDDLVRAARSSGTTQTQTMRVRLGRLAEDSRLVVARAARVNQKLTLLVARDVSEQERLQEMRKDFIANTSHELKTPVGAISLLAEAMEEAMDDPDQVRHFASRIAAESRRLGSLTARIMNLSKLQATDVLAEMADVSIDEVIAAAVEQHQTLAESADVKLVRGGDRGLYVRGSATILAEALGNLIANAVAYSPRASRVGIGVRGTADAVEIAVTDQGIGIAEDDQARVFERFYRADQARSRRTGGTGLGLSIVKHAVSRHGGDVRLWSQPDRGSTFTIRLPRLDAPVREHDEPKQSKRAKSKRLKKKVAVEPAREESETA